MIGRNRTAPSAARLFGRYTLQRPLSSPRPPCLARGILFWPPPVRLFAQPTHAREASRQHPAGDVDAYAHTHAHADELWGPQYVPLSHTYPEYVHIIRTAKSRALWGPQDVHIIRTYRAPAGCRRERGRCRRERGRCRRERARCRRARRQRPSTSVDPTRSSGHFRTGSALV